MVPSPTVQRKVVLYARVSQLRNESRSVPEQLDELREWAAREGWEVVEEFSDEVSASRYSTKPRTAWTAVMDTIQSGRANTLAVWEISRASRDRPVFAALISACLETGAMVATGGKLQDPADPDDGFMLDLGGALAVRESAMTSKRTRRDVEARAAAGRPHGSLPYGYRRVIDPDTGKTVGRAIDPVKGPVVAEIIRRLLAREPANAIAADLNRRGVPTATGSTWRGGNLSKLAVRPTYAGLRVHHGEVLEGVQATWDPIITVDEHHQLLDLYGDPERDKFRNPTHVKHLGSGIYRCGREGCDGRMRLVIGADSPPRYDCRTCHKISRHQGPVDFFVEETIIERLSREDALVTLTTSDDAEAQEAAAEASRLKAQLAEAREMTTKGTISLADFAAFRTTWEPQIAEAERRARPRSLPGAVISMAGPQARKRWEAAPITDRRTVLEALYRVTILPWGRGGQPFNPDSVSIESV